MKKVFFAFIAILGFAFTSNAQTANNDCMSDFTIQLDGTPVTTNGVTTFNIIAKPKMTQATAIANAAGCQSQWVPLQFAGGTSTKQFCDNYYPYIYSLTLPMNNGNFLSSSLPPTPNNGLMPLKKGIWYSLNRVVKNCSCSCLNSTSQYNFMLEPNNTLKICKTL